MTTLNIEIIKEDSLEKVVTESGLQISEGTEIKSSFLPYLVRLQEIVEQARKINTDNPTDIDEKIARELRLKTVKVRTGSEDEKDGLKKLINIKGNLITSSNNVIKNSCLLVESALEEVEKAREKKESARKEALRIERLDLLKPYCDNPEFYPLGEMDESGFNDLLNGMKLQAEAKVKAEQDRLEAERLLAEQKEKERIAYEAEQERIRKENEALKAEAERKEKELQKEREAAAKKLAEEQAKAKAEADKIAAENAAKLKAEKERADKIAAELKAKEDAEKEAKRLSDEAEKKRIAEEKKLAKAPDKIKMLKWVDEFDIADMPKGISDESGEVGLLVLNKFNAFKKWSKEQIEAL